MAGKTEWEDVLIKHGVMEAPKEQETEDDRHLKYIQSRDEVRSRELDTKSLAELEDQVSDDELEALRRKRIHEMRQQAALDRFGVVQTITQSAFVSEVSDASKSVNVVCHLFSRGTEDCDILDRLLGEVSRKHASVKFVRILGEEAIKGYPASACPTVLLYVRGEMVSQLVGLRAFGGKAKASADTVEWVLSLHRVVDTLLERNPLESLISRHVQRAIEKAEEEEDDEW
jgi:predicted DNA-binding protein (UPF0251 family)